MHHVGRDWRLDVIGHMWTRTHLSPMAADPRIVFHDYVSQDELERLFRECHVIVNPAIEEGFSHTIAEAMMRGLLALTSDIPIFREYVPSECRFPLDDPRSLARLVDELDAVDYARLREAGTRSVEQFSPAANAEGHRRLFRLLLGQSDNGAVPGRISGAPTSAESEERRQ
jgi:glycosyltransferase involved in cell wall biosynthesis